jgi:hypothetical protein
MELLNQSVDFFNPWAALNTTEAPAPQSPAAQPQTQPQPQPQPQTQPQPQPQPQTQPATQSPAPQASSNNPSLWSRFTGWLSSPLGLGLLTGAAALGLALVGHLRGWWGGLGKGAPSTTTTKTPKPRKRYAQYR